MRVVIAPDSFKECLRADEVAAAIEAGWRAGMPQAETQCFPMADGGEGTVDAVVRATGGERVSLRVSGPLGEAVEAHYGLIQGGKVAVLEMASASGLALVPEADRDPCLSSTYGTGELFVHALDRDIEDIIIGVGGSATNDGGAGMAQALGFKLLDKHGIELERGGARLIQLDCIDASGRHPRLSDINVYVACDVNNPICGANGASAVYGPQKGASSEDVLILDHALAHFAKIIERDLGVELMDIPGAGAAGGLAGGLLAFTGAKLEKGLELIATLCNLPQAIEGADLVITGEGSLDAQSCFGKTPVGLAHLAQPHGVPVLALGGRILPGADILLDHGITAIYPISPGPQSLDDARESAVENLRFTAEQVARTWNVAAKG
ncbi:MAG: glycerate kinase [Candidatus Hydrogenedentes bacterium]|nr:glycerate kinase [Candidatus Hydrogenedentota bacterium]